MTWTDYLWLYPWGVLLAASLLNLKEHSDG